jgi:hypothetical protein
MEEKDIPPDARLVACFRPFLDALAASDPSPKTIQKRVDKVWALGGEIIRKFRFWSSTTIRAAWNWYRAHWPSPASKCERNLCQLSYARSEPALD